MSFSTSLFSPCREPPDSHPSYAKALALQGSLEFEDAEVKVTFPDSMGQLLFLQLSPLTSVSF